MESLHRLLHHPLLLLPVVLRLPGTAGHCTALHCTALHCTTLHYSPRVSLNYIRALEYQLSFVLRPPSSAKIAGHRAVPSSGSTERFHRAVPPSGSTKRFHRAVPSSGSTGRGGAKVAEGHQPSAGARCWGPEGPIHLVLIPIRPSVSA